VAARNYRESRTRGRSLAAVARSVSTKRRGDAMKNKVFYGRTRAYFHPLEESAGEKGIPFACANDRQPVTRPDSGRPKILLANPSKSAARRSAPSRLFASQRNSTMISRHRRRPLPRRHETFRAHELRSITRLPSREYLRLHGPLSGRITTRCCTADNLRHVLSSFLSVLRAARKLFPGRVDSAGNHARRTRQTIL